MLKKIPLHIQIFLGMFLGVIFALIYPDGVGYVTPLGSLFIRLLKMIVVPLIFVSIVDGINKVGNAQKLSQLGFKTTAFYLTTNLLAVLTSLILVNWIKPGVGVKIFGTHKVPDVAPAEHLFDFIPTNALQAFTTGNTIQIIFLAILFGVAILHMKDKIPTIITVFNEANELLLKLTGGLVALAPIGVFGLMAGMVKGMDWVTFFGVGKFALVILLGLLIHGGITLPLFFKAMSDRPLIPFVKMMEPALLSAFSTSSSSATLPITMECIEKKAGVSKEIAGFVLPVGATVNMDGTAIYEAAACLFVAQAIGIELSLAQQLIVFFMSALAAIGAAAIPSAGLVTLVMVLNAVNLPIEGIGFLLAIDRPLDMSRTIVNVWGDMVGCVVVEGKNARKK